MSLPGDNTVPSCWMSMLISISAIIASISASVNRFASNTLFCDSLTLTQRANTVTFFACICPKRVPPRLTGSDVTWRAIALTSSFVTYLNVTISLTPLLSIAVMRSGGHPHKARHIRTPTTPVSGAIAAMMSVLALSLR